jgi:hypothetical protein
VVVRGVGWIYGRCSVDVCNNIGRGRARVRVREGGARKPRRCKVLRETAGKRGVAWGGNKDGKPKWQLGGFNLLQRNAFRTLAVPPPLSFLFHPARSAAVRKRRRLIQGRALFPAPCGCIPAPGSPGRALQCPRKDDLPVRVHREGYGGPRALQGDLEPFPVWHPKGAGRDTEEDTDTTGTRESSRARVPSRVRVRAGCYIHLQNIYRDQQGSTGINVAITGGAGSHGVAT